MPLTVSNLYSRRFISGTMRRTATSISEMSGRGRTSRPSWRQMMLPGVTLLKMRFAIFSAGHSQSCPITVHLTPSRWRRRNALPSPIQRIPYGARKTRGVTPVSEAIVCCVRASSAQICLGDRMLGLRLSRGQSRAWE